MDQPILEGRKLIKDGLETSNGLHVEETYRMLRRNKAVQVNLDEPLTFLLRLCDMKGSEVEQSVDRVQELLYHLGPQDDCLVL